MTYGLFLGCTVPARGRNYELAARAVAGRLGIELVDVEDFACCGFPTKSIDWQTPLLMAARNLSAAEERGLNICTLCSACTSILTETNHELQQDSGLKDEVNRKLHELGRSYDDTVKVRHFARLLYEEVGVERIREEVKKGLDGLRIAIHYGCHYLKPSDIYDHFDDPEYPTTLDELVEATGAESVHYEEKKLCCGGAILGVDEDVALTLARRKLEHIKAAGADAICLICPFCSIMYDDNQRKIEGKFETEYNLPVLYYPQLLGLALGFERRELGLHMNTVRTDGLLEKLG